jgi:arsenate reductase (glutaredoxin)
VKATIWHNPRCSKSREALAILRDTPGLSIEIVEYLRDPPPPDELRRVLGKAGLTPRQALRASEADAAGLEQASDDDIIDAMMMHPILIGRPIVETDKGAVLARPPERVREIL